MCILTYISYLLNTHNSYCYYYIYIYITTENICYFILISINYNIPIISEAVLAYYSLLCKCKEHETSGCSGFSAWD